MINNSLFPLCLLSCSLDLTWTQQICFCLDNRSSSLRSTTSCVSYLLVFPLITILISALGSHFLILHLPARSQRLPLVIGLHSETTINTYNFNLKQPHCVYSRVCTTSCSSELELQNQGFHEKDHLIGCVPRNSKDQNVLRNSSFLASKNKTP